jgi:BirA family biotin operon repressor/biotin-[acetyl-CoA-carboxylase] ligase
VVSGESDTPRDEWHLDTHLLGRRVLIYERLDSTNTLAASFATDPGNEGVVILADAQTAGRGQHGRSWVSHAGLGVWLSVLLFPPPPLRRPVILAAWAAYSVCETIRQMTSLEAKIKWPNDVLIHSRKVCGILVEQGTGTVVGIGLNVNQDESDFVNSALPQAGSLAIMAGQNFPCTEVARRLIHTLDEEYDRLRQGDLATLESCWKSRLGLLGKQVTVECHHASHKGRLRDLGWDGVQLDLDKGSILRLVPETVTQITESLGSLKNSGG